MRIILDEKESLSSALQRAKRGDEIVLADRTYREKVVIKTDGLIIRGSDGGSSKVVYGDYANKIHADGKEYNTFRTFTVAVAADDVKFIGFSIENDAGAPEKNGQQVALTVYGKNFFAKDMTLYSTQDTLFVGPLPDDLITRYRNFLPDELRYFEGEAFSLFLNCRIYGSVDYIFGCGSAYFFDCDLISVDDGRKEGYVCAPAHSLKQVFGITFIDCRFKKPEDSEIKEYLARPWRDYGKATFIGCACEGGFAEELFDKWNDTKRDNSARFEIYDQCVGERAVGWLKKLDKEQALKYIEKLNELNETIGL